MRGRIVTAVLAVWALTAVAAYAAVDVTGVVKDPSGGVVADATVTVMTAEQTAVATRADRRPGPVHPPGPQRRTLPADGEEGGARRVADAV